MNKIIEKIKNVDETYKKSFYIICAIAFFVFFREIISLRWGNHDWYSILGSVPINYQWHEGRFFFTILQFLTGFKCITYISNTLYLLGLISGLMLLTKYWEIPKKVSNIVLFVLFYLLMPSTLCYIYYKVESINFGFGLFFIVLSIITALKINKAESIKKKIICFFISYIFLFVFVLGSCPPLINTIFVVLSGKMLLNYADSGFKISSVKEYIKEHKYFFMVLILSAISEFLVIGYLKVIKIFQIYRDSILINFFSVEEIKNHFIYSIKLMYKLLFTTFQYIGIYAKVLLFTIVLFAFVFILIKILKTKLGIFNKLQKILTFMFLFVLTAWLSLFSYFITPGYSEIELRVNHMGYDFVYLLCLMMLIKFVKRGILRKAVIVLSILIIYNSGINTIYAQQISDMAFNAEMQFQNRVLERIEEHPNFSYDKEYKYIRLGLYASFKLKLYNGINFNKYCVELCGFDSFLSYTYKYLTPYNLVINDYNEPWIYFHYYLQENDIPDEIKDYILNTAKVWPDKDSVYVSDEYIIIVFDEEVLARSKEVLIEKQENKNEQNN